MSHRTTSLLSLLLVTAACAAGDGAVRMADDAAMRAQHAGDETMLSIRSDAFVHESEIPKKHTCEGDDVSPALSFAGAPEGTRSLALIVDDPDAPDPRSPKMTWVHWVLHDLPADSTGLPEGGMPLPAGTREGRNDWKRTGWGGPCPPVGRHRYFLKLYALDAMLGDVGKHGKHGEPTKDQLLAAMEGHVVAEAVLMGTYEKAAR